MQCEQIRPWLNQYAEGSLPGYKVAWVVQHLAGCTACTAVSDEARGAVRRSPGAASPRATARAVAAAATETRHRPAEAQLEDIQRPVPRWLRWATVLLIAAAAGGAAWLFLGSPAPHESRHASSRMRSAAVGSGSPIA